jgi:hypothetical protein
MGNPKAQQHPEDTTRRDSSARMPEMDGDTAPAGTQESSAGELAHQQTDAQDIAAQPHMCMSNQQPGPSMDTARSPGQGYAAAAAWREEAQELALEQAILVRALFQHGV